MRLQRCRNVADLQSLAARRLPKPVLHYLEGGADDEWSLRRNIAAFGNFELLPEVLRDVSNIDLRSRLLGKELAMPLVLAPTATSQLFHAAAETGVARAAASAQVYYALSTMATTSLEQIAALEPGPRMFQIYIFKDRELTREFVARCKVARYDALCLTVDTPLAGNRERDRASGMTVPPRLTPRSLWNIALRPAWALGMLLGPRFELTNVAHRTAALAGTSTSLLDYVNRQFDRSVNWDDVAWLIAEWGGPFVLKGLQSAGDAKHAAQAGASALMISNHGGRQLDCAPAAIDRLSPIREAVGDALELIVDGGIRRGTDILKALAMGANACAIGRPYLYALAAGGQQGVEHLLQLLKAELERDMTLLGTRRLCDIGARHLSQRRGC